MLEPGAICCPYILLGSYYFEELQSFSKIVEQLTACAASNVGVMFEALVLEKAYQSAIGGWWALRAVAGTCRDAACFVPSTLAGDDGCVVVKTLEICHQFYHFHLWSLELQYLVDRDVDFGKSAPLPVLSPKFFTWLWLVRSL